MERFGRPGRLCFADCALTTDLKESLLSGVIVRPENSLRYVEHVDELATSST